MRIMTTLIAPTRAENTGAVARAIKTMGLGELRIVDSQAHLESVARWVAYGSGDTINNIKVFKTLVESLYDVDLTVATTMCSWVKYHYYATLVELVLLLEEKSPWMSYAVLVFGRENSGLTNEELALADVLTGVPMVVDHPSLNPEQVVMAYCYQLATLIQRPAKSDTTAGQHQL